MTTFNVKGWCPGALRPMMSADGLVVRVRPRAGRITQAQAIGIAEAARAFGSGIIDLSSRANIQLRGIRTEAYADLLAQLDSLALLDATAAIETRRNIIVAPLDDENRTGNALALALEAAIANCNLSLPSKFGFAIDTGDARLLADVSADIRIERGQQNQVLVRVDTASYGVPVQLQHAADVAIEVAQWFLDSGGVKDGRGRMAAHIASGAQLPDHLQGRVLPVSSRSRPVPGIVSQGAFVAVAFGSLQAETLDALARNASELHITPWRMFFLPDVTVMPSGAELVTDCEAPILRIEACPGQPFCSQAMMETRSLARQIAPHIPSGALLHISGCAKGCACSRSVDWTLVGSPNGFDLISNGDASSKPLARGLAVSELSADPSRFLRGNDDLRL